MSLVFRRLLAFALDYLVILGYLIILGAASLEVLNSGLGQLYSAAWSTAWTAELMGFLTLTLPVVLYFAILEASTAGGTIGKRVLAVAVRALDGTPLRIKRSLVRSAAKFLPWELAHFTIWHYVYARTAAAQPPLWTTISLVFVYALVAAFLMTLIVGSHRTIYDRLAGSRVELIGKARRDQGPVGPRAGIPRPGQAAL